MALKNSKGNIIRVVRIEGIDLIHKIAAVRVYHHNTEEDRANTPNEPDKNYYIESRTLTDKQIKALYEIGYDLFKNHEVKTEKRHEATEEKAAWTEDVFEYPHREFEDVE